MGYTQKTDTKFGQVSISAYKAGGTILASREILADAFIDVESYIRGLTIDGLAELEEQSFVSGNGVGKPTGFTVSADVGKTTAGLAAITSDEIIDLFYSLRAPYRKSATFTFSDDGCKAIRKLKDANGQLYLERWIWSCCRYNFRFRPVETLVGLDGLGTGKIFGAFGDFSYYQIADRGQMSMMRLK